MSDVYLAAIAVAVVVMAVIQVAAVIVAMRAARRVGEAVSRFERDVRPMVTHLTAMSADAARTASIASAQAQRAEQLLGDLSSRVTHTVAAVEATVVTPAREAYAMVQGLMAALAAFRQAPAPPASRRPTAAEEEDALFIG